MENREGSQDRFGAIADEFATGADVSDADMQYMLEQQSAVRERIHGYSPEMNLTARLKRAVENVSDSIVRVDMEEKKVDRETLKEIKPTVEKLVRLLDLNANKTLNPLDRLSAVVTEAKSLEDSYIDLIAQQKEEELAQLIKELQEISECLNYEEE